MQIRLTGPIGAATIRPIMIPLPNRNRKYIRTEIPLPSLHSLSTGVRKAEIKTAICVWSGNPTEFPRPVKRQAGGRLFPPTQTSGVPAIFRPRFGHGLGQNLTDAELQIQFVMELLEIGKFFPL